MLIITQACNLPFMENVFKTAVYRWPSFLNDLIGNVVHVHCTLYMYIVG